MKPPPPTPEQTGSLAPHPEQAEERINLGRVVAVGLVSLAAFSLGTAWAYFILRGRDPDLRGPGDSRGAGALGAPEIGLVDQVPFAGDRRLQDLESEQRRRLASWGWVDRRRGVVHMPIEEAMNRLLGEPGAGR